MVERGGVYSDAILARSIERGHHDTRLRRGEPFAKLHYVTLRNITLHCHNNPRLLLRKSIVTLHYITLHCIALPRHAPAPPRALRQPSARAHPRARARCCSAAGRADSARETRNAQQMRMADGDSWRVVKEEEDSPRAGRTSRTAREECGRRPPP